MSDDRISEFKRDDLLKSGIMDDLLRERNKKKKKNKKSKRKKRKSKKRKSKKRKYKKRYIKIQTGGADDAFLTGLDAPDDGVFVDAFGERAAAAAAMVGAAAALGGPTAAVGAATTLAGAQVVGDTLNATNRVINNNLCECRGWHFIDSDEPDFECKGCLKPSGLFGLVSGNRPTPRCPSSNSCCRGRFQGVLGRDELNTVNIIQPGQQPLPINLCNQCKQSRDEIRAKFPGLTADTDDGIH
jgi:hypothetical protein